MRIWLLNILFDDCYIFLFFLQEETMSKTGRYSAVRVRANPPGRAKLASKLADQSQRGPVRTTPAIYLQQRVKVRTWHFFYKKFTRHTHTHTHTHTVCLDNKSWEEVLSEQCFLFVKRERSCPGTCAVPFLCDLSYGPPLAGSWSPLCHPIKKNPRIAHDSCPFNVPPQISEPSGFWMQLPKDKKIVK